MTGVAHGVNPVPLRRAAAILLLLAFTGLGTGLLERLHDVAHAHDAAADAGPACPEPADPHHHHRPHDAGDTDCRLYASLKAPLLSSVTVPLLVRLGPCAGMPAPPVRPLVSFRIPSRLDCRGPPVA